MLLLHSWKSELVWSTRAKTEQSSYHMKRDNQVYSFITGEEEGDVSELHSRKQWKPTPSWPPWVLMNKRTSSGSKYTITVPNRSSQNSQGTTSYPPAKARQEAEQKDNHLRRRIMWHQWTQMTRCFPSNHPQQPLPVYSKQRPRLWPPDIKLRQKCWFIFTLTNSTKSSLIHKISPSWHLWAMTRVASAVHITDRLNNSNSNKEGPPNNPPKTILCGGKSFLILPVRAVTTNVCILKFISCNQHPRCRPSSRVLSVQHHPKWDRTPGCQAPEVKVQ